MRRCLMSLLAGLSALMLILGACGDDDSDDSAESSTTISLPEGDQSPGTDDSTGANTDDSTGTNDPPSTDTTVPSNGGGSGPSAGAYCAVFAEIAAVDDPFEAGDGLAEPAERRRVMREAFAVFVVQIEAAADVAPSEIAADTATVAGGVRSLIELLEQYDYDFDALERAVANDPDVGGEFDEIEQGYSDAAERVEDFVEDECGIDL